MPIPRLPLWPLKAAPDRTDADETERADTIAAYGVESFKDDPELKQVTDFAASLCEVPIALVTIVEEHRQRFLSRTGLDAEETPRSTSFCAHAMLMREPMIVRDATLDPRFADNPLVTGEPHIRFYAGMPLVSSEGIPLGALCVIDHTPRPEGLTEFQRQGLEVLAQTVMRRLTSEREALFAETELTRSEQRVRQLAENLPVLAWAANAEGTLEYANAPLVEYAGTDDFAHIDFEKLVHPEDIDRLIEVRKQSRIDLTMWESKGRVRRQDGAYRWMVMRAWPVRTDGNEVPETWFGAAVDIDDLHRLSDSRDLLARELTHRIKNIFAVISGLIAVRSRLHPDAGQFVDELQSAVRALAAAHDYVRPHQGRKSPNLQGLLADLLAPYHDEKGGTVRITGGDCKIGEQTATPLALIFHELATNSAKYGALSGGGGSVWVKIETTEDQVLVDWTEQGLPDADNDDLNEGFGSRLLRMAVENQLDGSFDREFIGNELHIKLAMSLAIVCDG